MSPAVLSSKIHNIFAANPSGALQPELILSNRTKTKPIAIIRRDSMGSGTTGQLYAAFFINNTQIRGIILQKTFLCYLDGWMAGTSSGLNKKWRIGIKIGTIRGKFA